MNTHSIVRKGSSHKAFVPLVWALAALICGIGISALGAIWKAQENRRIVEAKFESLTADTVVEIQRRLSLYVYGLRGARGAALAAGFDSLNRQDFQNYSQSRSIESEFPGARGFGLIRRVPVENEAAYVVSMQKNGWPEFKLRQLHPQDGERYIIEFIEPISANAAAIGLDIASEVNRKAAADLAITTNMPAITAPIALVQAQGPSKSSFLLLLPIYRSDSKLDTVEDRMQAALGWAYAPLSIDQVLATADLHRSQLSFSLRDTGADSSTVFFTQSAPSSLSEEFQKVERIQIFGRTWDASFSPTAAFVKDLNLLGPIEVFSIGAMLSLLLTAAMYGLKNAAIQQTAVAYERSQRSAMVHFSADAIIAEGLDGMVIDWNPAAERLLGFSASIAKQRPLASLILPPARAHEDKELIDQILVAPQPKTFDTTRLNSDGQLIDVAITVGPMLDAKGNVVGIVKTLRDVRDIKKAQTAIAELNSGLEQQVIERTKQLDALRRDLQNILDAVPSMIGYWDNNLKNRVANRAYEKWFGIAPGDLTGKHIRELLGEDIFKRNQPYIEGALAGEPQIFERAIPTPDGLSSRHSLAYYIPDVINGEVKGFYVLVHDVTELVEGRLKLAALQRDNEALLRTINTHTIVSVTDSSGRITEANDTFCKTFGYSLQELIGRMHHELLESGQQGADFWTSIWRTISSGMPWQGDICVQTKTGEHRWVSSIVAPFIAGEGAIEKFISISFDITVARQAAQELRESQTFLERASTVAKLGAWQLNLEMTKATWSPQLKSILEVAPDFVPTPDSAYDRYLPEYRPVLQAAAQKCLDDGTPWDLEVRLTTSRGRQIWARVVGEATFENGRTVGLVGILQDISRRKEAELALASERHLMSSLLQTVPDQIYFKDRESRFLRINPGLATRYGLDDPSEAIGKSDADFFSTEHAAATFELERSIMESGTPIVDLEEQEIWIDKPSTWNLSTKMPLRDMDGQVIGMFGISRDITARKNMEAALQASNARFEMAAEGASLGVWDFDLVNNTLVWDARVYALFGVDPNHVSDPIEIWKKSLHPEDQATYDLAANDTLARGQPLDIEFRIIRPDGEIRYLKSAARVQRNAVGQPAHLTGVNFDITERKRAELALKDASSLLENVLESASEIAIIATDTNLLIRVFNEGAQRLLGYSSTEMVGLMTPMAIHDANEVQTRSEEMAAQLGLAVDGGMVFTHSTVLRSPREWTYVHKNGNRIAVSLVVTAMHDASGEIFGYLGVATDITKQKEVENDLRQAIQKAKQANRAKSQFLANMSHEIRTPMNAVIGLTYLLGHTTLNPEQETFLEKIRQASQSLLILINDVLDLSKIEANELTIEKIPFDLNKVLREPIEMMEMQAQAKGLRLTSDLPPNLPKALRGDPTRLQQILTNLLSNAIKFTSAGQVSLVVSSVPSVQSGCRIRFSVKDTGIGIQESAQANLFQPFVQADTSTTRKFGGTGLGLSIVKHLVALMGGDLGLVSKPGIGSEFWFELQLEETSEMEDSKLSASQSNPDTSGLQGVRVLVVDDNAINLEVAKRILQMQGAIVSFAHHGQQAIDLLTEGPSAYDAVLMDVQMPEMDGLTATRIIRQKLGLTRLPIIALSAGAMLEEQQDAAAAGMNDFVPKPFDVKRLVSSIRGLLNQPPPPVDTVATLPASHTEWPDIDGISTHDAFARLSGDWNLFMGMLKLLFREHMQPIPSENALKDSQTLMELGRRMHKLKGAAGTLGLNEVYRLASLTEAASMNGDIPAALSAAVQVSDVLQHVHGSAIPHLNKYQKATEEALTIQKVDLSFHDLEELRQLLQRQNIDAVSKFESMQAQIKPLLGAAEFAQLRNCIEELQFEKATGLLATLVT